MNRKQIQEAVKGRLEYLKVNNVPIVANRDFDGGMAFALTLVFTIIDEIEGIEFQAAMDKADS